MTTKRGKLTLTEMALTIFISHYFSLDWIRFLYYVKVHNDPSKNQNQVVAAAEAIRVLTMMRGNNVCAKGLIVVNYSLEILCGLKLSEEEMAKYKEIMREFRSTANTSRLHRTIAGKKLKVLKQALSEQQIDLLASRAEEQAIKRVEKGRQRYFESQMELWNQWKENDRGKLNIMYDMWREMLFGSFKQPFYLAAEAFESAEKGGFTGEMYRKAGKMFIDGAREMMSNGGMIADDNWKMYYDVQENKICENRSLVLGSKLLTLAKSIDASYQIAQQQRRLCSYLLREERSRRLNESSIEEDGSSFSLMTIMVSLNSKVIEKLTSLNIYSPEGFNFIILNADRILSTCKKVKDITEVILTRKKQLHEVIQGFLRFDEYPIVEQISDNFMNNWQQQTVDHLTKLQQDIRPIYGVLSSEYDGWGESFSHSRYCVYSERLIAVLRLWQQEMNDVRRDIEESKYSSLSYYDKEVLEIRQMRLSYITRYVTLQKWMKKDKILDFPFPQTFHSSSREYPNQINTRQNPILFSTWEQDEDPDFTFSLLTSSLQMSYWLRSNERKIAVLRKRMTKNTILSFSQMNQREEMLVLVERLYDYTVTFVRECFERCRAGTNMDQLNSSMNKNEDGEGFVWKWRLTREYKKESKAFEYFKDFVFGIEVISECLLSGVLLDQQFLECLSNLCTAYKFIIVQQLIPASASFLSIVTSYLLYQSSLYFDYLQPFGQKYSVSDYSKSIFDSLTQGMYFSLIGDQTKEELEQLKIDLIEHYEKEYSLTRERSRSFLSRLFDKIREVLLSSY